MTKQISGSIGPIRIGGGFRGKIGLRNYEYPPDRLTEFLKLDLNNESELGKYCNDYQLIISFMNRDTTLRAIKEEQEKLKKISTKLFAKQNLNLSEIKLVNSRLGKIKLTISYPASNNHGIQNTPSSLKEQFEERHLITHKTYGDVFASFWEDLITHFVTKQDIKQCINCGHFFVPINRHERLYCSIVCGNALKQSRHRARKKGKM